MKTTTPGSVDPLGPRLDTQRALLKISRLLLLSERPQLEPGLFFELHTLAQSVIEAAQSGRLGDRDWELVENLSHDLKNPLSAIATSLEVLASGRAGAIIEPKQQRMLALAQRNTERLGKMIESFAAEAHSREGETLPSCEEMRVAELFQQSLPPHLPVAESVGCDLAWVTDHGCSVHCDPVSLQRILDNLVENAVKFSGRGGNVLVTARQEACRDDDELSRAAASLGFELQGTEILVEDDGPGMSQEACEHAFERNWQAESRRHLGGGFGLGLSIVHSLTLAQRGTVRLSRGERRGLRARIWLPVDRRCFEFCSELQTLSRELDWWRSRAQAARLLLLEIFDPREEILSGFARLVETLKEEGRSRWSVHHILSNVAVVLLPETEPYPEVLSSQLLEDQTSSTGVLRQGSACFPRDGERLECLLERAREPHASRWLAAVSGAGQQEVLK